MLLVWSVELVLVDHWHRHPPRPVRRIQVLLAGGEPHLCRQAVRGADFGCTLLCHPKQGILRGLKLPWKRWSYIGHPILSQDSCYSLRSCSAWHQNRSGYIAGGDSGLLQFPVIIQGADIGHKEVRVVMTRHQGFSINN